MFDDLRNDSQASQLSDDEIDNLLASPDEKPAKVARRKSSGKILGMTAGQRFVLSFLILGVTCLGGSVLLLALGRIVPF